MEYDNCILSIIYTMYTLLSNLYFVITFIFVNKLDNEVLYNLITLIQYAESVRVYSWYNSLFMKLEL